MGRSGAQTSQKDFWPFISLDYVVGDVGQAKMLLLFRSLALSAGNFRDKYVPSMGKGML